MSGLNSSAGRFGQGQRLIKQTEPWIFSSRGYQAALYRLKGERLLACARDHGIDAAAACFEQSLAIARQQEALSHELRAAVSLARLHHGRSLSAMARDVILAVYKRFHEGFDTLDLREARSLLDLRGDG